MTLSVSTLAARALRTAFATQAAGRRRRRAAGLAVVLLALAVLTLLYGAIAPRGTAATGDSALGHQLYEKYSCASCHGLNGEGGARAPSLIGVGAAAVDFQMSTGRMPLQHHGAQAPRHPPVASEPEIHAIADWVQSIGGGPLIPDASGWQNTDVAFGGALFRTNCAQCHNFVGQGGSLTYGRYAPSLTRATPTQIYEAMITGPENMPVFGDKTITHDQKLAIINYVKSVQREANPGGSGLGRIGPVSETLVGILAGLGLAVLATLWLGTRA